MRHDIQEFLLDVKARKWQQAVTSIWLAVWCLTK